MLQVSFYVMCGTLVLFFVGRGVFVGIIILKDDFGCFFWLVHPILDN